MVSTTPCTRTPANLPFGCSALRCEVRSVSGAAVTVILGGQPSVLADDKLVEHALRMTLVADSLSLQFRLPPPGSAAPQQPQPSVAVAGGAQVWECVSPCITYVEYHALHISEWVQLALFVLVVLNVFSSRSVNAVCPWRLIVLRHLHP